MKFLGKWMYLEDIILSEVTQSPKNPHNMPSLMKTVKVSQPCNEASKTMGGHM